MTPPDQSSREKVAEVCYELGCSGLSKRCPADPMCEILRKIFRPAEADDD